METAHAESENAAATLKTADEAQTAFDTASDRQTRAAEKAVQALEAEIESSRTLEAANKTAALKAANEAEILEAVNALQAPQAPTPAVKQRRLLTMESLLREIELS